MNEKLGIRNEELEVGWGIRLGLWLSVDYYDFRGWLDGHIKCL